MDRIPLFIHPVEKMLDVICDTATQAIANCNHYYDCLCLKCGIEYVKTYARGLPSILAHASLLRQNTKAVQNGEHGEEKLFAPGMKRVFFFNPMYNAVNYYRVYVPENYSPDKKYPLVIIYSTFENGDLSICFKNYSAEPVIAVDISGRGVLLGSSIGDAAIQIALKDALSRFSIDNSRIYCTGNSNGGGAAWAQIEAYPDVFAGAYIVSGHPNHDLLSNISNMKLLYLSSTIDHMYEFGYRRVQEKLLNHPDSTGFLGENFSHEALWRIWFNTGIFHTLLQACLNEFPDHVTYRTLRNRHRKAYWVEIHSIGDGQTEGIIDARICSSKRIKIHCTGINGFSIIIPPQINTEEFVVSINDEFVYTFIKECSQYIHFEQTNTQCSNFFEPVGDYIIFH